MVARFDTISCR